MSEHPNVAVINRMTKAVFENDRDTLTGLFTEDIPSTCADPCPGPVTTKAPPPADALDVQSGLKASPQPREHVHAAAPGPRADLGGLGSLS